jgi:uncharacterized Zn-binding protein involved in type VI secretion
LDDGIRLPSARSALFDALLHTLRRMLRQELQDPDELAGACGRTVAFFQVGPEFGEDRRELPTAVYRGMVQGGRAPLETVQIVQRIENFLMALITAWVLGHDALVCQHRHVSDVALHRHDAKCVSVRHTVAVIVEAHSLVLVNLGWSSDARVERTLRQWQRLRTLVFEALPNGFFLAGYLALTILQTAFAQVTVQLGQIGDARHRRGPAAL